MNIKTDFFWLNLYLQTSLSSKKKEKKEEKKQQNNLFRLSIERSRKINKSSKNKNIHLFGPQKQIKGKKLLASLKTKTKHNFSALKREKLLFRVGIRDYLFDYRGIFFFNYSYTCTVIC